MTTKQQQVDKLSTTISTGCFYYICLFHCHLIQFSCCQKKKAQFVKGVGTQNTTLLHFKSLDIFFSVNQFWNHWRINIWGSTNCFINPMKSKQKKKKNTVYYQSTSIYTYIYLWFVSRLSLYKPSANDNSLMLSDQIKTEIHIDQIINQFFF